jgi:hypothetical protein
LQLQACSGADWTQMSPECKSPVFR